MSAIWIDVIGFPLGFVAGLLARWLTPRNRLVCGCGHHRAFHGEDGGCQEQVRGEHAGGNLFARRKHVQCRCARYVGLPAPGGDGR